MKTSDFDYELPEELIAQTPVEPRDQSRLLVYRRKDQSIEHKHFFDIIDYLNPGDALVINETRVIPARLLGVKEDTGVPVEVLLLRRLSTAEWEALVRPGRRLKPGTRCVFGDGLLACEILGNVEVHEKLKDRDRYQTVYAKQDGSAAAPTAGLHFTPELLDRIRQKGITVVPVLLHVGLGTFRPVKVEDAEKHVMHSEFCRVTQEAADILNRIRAAGGRIVCVGTTSVRTLETFSREDGTIVPGAGDTAIFIYPGVKLKAVDALITNFHLPQSTLLMLVSALMGREEALRVYRTAVEERYRFFSFGDAMFIE